MLTQIERLHLGANLAACAGELEFLAHKVGDEEVETATQLAIKLADLGNKVHQMTKAYARDVRD